MQVSTFENLGLTINFNFLSEAETADLREISQTLPAEDLQIVRDGKSSYDPETRMGRSLELPLKWEALIAKKLTGIQNRLGERYNCSLKGFERVQLLAYGPDHFFKPHRDSCDEASSPDYLKSRQVTVVIPVGRPDLDWQGGGDLVMYGLIKQPGFEAAGLSVPLEAGTLIAFRSDELHAVTPIQTGKRLCLVTWFHH